MKATHIKITAHPSNQSKIYIDEAVFTITAEGDGTLFYQWQKDGGYNNYQSSLLHWFNYSYSTYYICHI